MTHRLFITLEDALNFIEMHEEKNDMHLFTMSKKGGITEKTGASLFWASFKRALGFQGNETLKLEIIKDATKHLRDDYSDIRSEKIQATITDLEQKTEKTNREQWHRELKHLFKTLNEDAAFKLKRLQVIVESCSKKIEKLKDLDNRSVPAHILDLLTEIEDEMKMYEEEHDILESRNEECRDIIEGWREIDAQMEKVHQAYLQRLPNALNWGIMLSLTEMTENGIPELKDITQGAIFEIGSQFVEEAGKKYEQLRALYLKYQNKLRADLKGSFDNNFAEYEGRLYFAKQVVEHQQKGTTDATHK